jgi:hypothetical protein
MFCISTGTSQHKVYSSTATHRGAQCDGIVYLPRSRSYVASAGSTDNPLPLVLISLSAGVSASLSLIGVIKLENANDWVQLAGFSIG